MITLPDRSTTVREPQQKRSRRSLDRIVKATEKLLEDRSFDELSVDDVASAAHVSIGSFYARFSGKDALLPLLYERYRDTMDLADRSLDHCKAATLAEMVKTIIASQVVRFRQHRGLLRTLAFRERSNSSSIQGQMVQWARHATRRRVAALRPFVKHNDHSNPDQAIEFGLFFAMAALREKILFGQSPHARVTRLSDRKLASELSRMLTSYLLASRTECANHSSRERMKNLERQHL